MPKLQLLAEIVPRTELKLSLCENPAWVSDIHRRYSYVLSPPLACDHAYELYSRVNEKLKPLSCFVTRIPFRRIGFWFLFLAAGSKFIGFPIPLSRVPYETWQLDSFQQQELISAITQLLQGRFLQEQLIENQLRKQGWWPADISRALARGTAEGKFNFLPGALKYPWGILKCSRCNSQITEYRPCFACGRSQCPICLACEALGSIRGCNRLWTAAVEPDTGRTVAGNKPPVSFCLDFSLTQAQKQASAKLVKFLHSDHQYVLVWAACGAGKTEVTFAAIEQVLKSKEQVLFAIPRRDVVVQLVDRIRRAFSNVNIAVHYGGKPWDQNGQLVIATTHQALRFNRRFALVILDEVDAFPYQGSEILRYAIKRSLKPNAKLIEMTATPIKLPSPAKLITIPARYHGHPLPEPDLLKIRLPDLRRPNDEFQLPDEIVSIIKRRSAPWLIFVPTIAAVKAVAEFLSQQLDKEICYCYAADPNRDQKIEGLLHGNYQVMVATSIMERGITVANIQVMVLYCNHHIYDVNALVQMAGRVGRTVEYADGEVWFVCEKVDDKVKTARKRIKFLNQQAKAQGLLREFC